MEQKIIAILLIIFMLLTLYEIAQLESKVQEKENTIIQLKYQLEYSEYSINDSISQ